MSVPTVRPAQIRLPLRVNGPTKYKRRAGCSVGDEAVVSTEDDRRGFRAFRGSAGARPRVRCIAVVSSPTPSWPPPSCSPSFLPPARWTAPPAALFLAAVRDPLERAEL